MRKLLSIALVALVGFASCAKEEGIGNPTETSTITASTTTLTRIQMTETGGEDILTWKTGDQIIVVELEYTTNLFDAIGSKGYKIKSPTSAFFYTLKPSFAGKTTGEFSADLSNVGSPTTGKIYMAFHAGKDILGALPGVSAFSFKSFKNYGTGTVAVDNTKESRGVTTELNSRWAEDFILIRALVEFNPDGSVKPLAFKNDISAMVEVQMTPGSVSTGVVPPIAGNSNAFEFTMLNFKATGTEKVFPNEISFLFDESFNIKENPTAPSGDTNDFNASFYPDGANNFYVYTGLTYKIRIPILVRPVASNNIEAHTITMTGWGYSIQCKQSITKTIPAGQPIFPVGKTTVIPYGMDNFYATAP